MADTVSAEVEWPEDWTPEMRRLYCEDHDQIHSCGEFAIGDDPHGDERLIPCYMNGACLACRHPFQVRRKHFRMRDEEKRSFPLSYERAVCACGFRGPWRLDYESAQASNVERGNDTAMMDAIWHGIIWRSQGTKGEAGMAILAGMDPSLGQLV